LPEEAILVSETRHELSLTLVSPGVWSLAADGTLLATVTGQDDPADAQSWASHTLRTSHGVIVELWTPDIENGEKPAFRATATDANMIDIGRDPFRFERGKPFPVVPWPGRSGQLA
jgi:hypothetical protein